MARVQGYQDLISRLQAYKKKYYHNKLIKGGLLATGMVITGYLIVNSLEYGFHLGTPLRATLFFGFLILSGWALYQWVINPIYKLFTLNRQLSNEQAAVQIGRYFPSVNDKLLNTLQLHALSASENDLIAASISQKTQEISAIPFVNAINFKDNRRYLKFLLVPLSFLLIILLAAPQLFTESTPRLIHFNKNYTPAAPFQFELQNTDLTAFKNEDYQVLLTITGGAIPETAYITTKDRKIKMQQNEQGQFEFNFIKIQRDTEFEFEAAGYTSSPYAIKVVSRPALKSFDIQLNYPRYLQKQNENLQNTGNLQVPQGTDITWSFNALQTDSLSLNFEREKASHHLQSIENQKFVFNKKATSSDRYTIELKNDYSSNKEQIEYRIDVIKDKYPQITLDQYRDTTLFSYMVFGGNISDDYGLSRLRLYYSLRKTGESQPGEWKYIPIGLKTDNKNQSYYFQWEIDSLELAQGDRVDYYLRVWDNDGVNGPKSTKTSSYQFKLPTRQEVNESLEQEAEKNREQMDESLQDAQELSEKIQEAEDRLKTKNNLDWQDKKLLQEIIERKEALTKEIERLKELNQNHNQQKERFNEYSENLKTKIDQLQKLMDDLLDEKTKQLYEELQQLLNEQQNSESFRDLLQELNYKEQNFEQELERAIELFKRMQFEQKLEETLSDLQELQDQQEDLMDKTDDREQTTESLEQDQSAIKEDFDQLKESLDELREKNQDLENSHMFEDTFEEEQKVDEGLKESQEQLQRGKRNNSQKGQKQAVENMKQMNQKLQQMQGGMEMEMMQENLDNLRDIEDNLIKLSFDQEDLMKQFQDINQSDPRFIELSQQQLKLKDDAKIIEDSLLSLANRVFQIQSFVTREVKEMNEHMEQSLDGLKKRNKSQSLSNQQLTMTSINNLALLLSDVLQQMQQQMAQAQGAPSNKNSKKNQPGLSQLQQQLNQQIENLKKSGKSGRALSEELAKLAAQQEMIRKALREAEEGIRELGEEGQKGTEEIRKKMEETETDLVNKQITSETIKRQKEILTRLLEAEKSIRERELDKAREAEQATKKVRQVPPEFEEYLKAKEKEVELLRTVPPKLNPYYKQEVNDYFKRIDN